MSRCELLLGVCRPLAGEPCSGAVSVRLAVIRVAGLVASPGAAVVLNHRTQEAVITPIQVVNFPEET